MNTRALALLIAIALVGCTAEIGQQSGDPFAVDVDSVSAELRQNVLNRRAIFLANQLASDVFQDAVNAHLVGLGIPAEYEDAPMTPDGTRLGAIAWRDGRSRDAVDPAAFEPATAASCPWAEPAPAIDPSSISCRYLAGEVQRRAETRAAQRFAETPITGEFVEDAPDPEQVVEWYETGFNFGVGWSPDVLVGALRTAGACDTTPTPSETAYELGVRAGREMMAEQVRIAEDAAPRTRCDTDFTVMEPARSAAMGLIDTTVAANDLCAGYTPPGPTELNRLTAAETQLRDGVAAGIEEQAREDSARLVREFVCTPPPTTGGGGDPLVLDLDGNGVHIDALAYGPSFDFGETGLVRTEWILGDAFVVLDRDGDRAITATELFGDISETEDGAREADGLRALALYDHPTRGGNGDGRIDAQDRVYAQLELWQDADGDARADRGELRTLRAARVRAIDLRSERWVDAGGEEHLAADVWFRHGR